MTESSVVETILTPAKEEKSASSQPLAVSVVIPTILRESLSNAVSSVVRQDYPRHLLEVVVVVDRATTLAPDLTSQIKGVDKWIFTGGGARGGRARNMGVHASTGDLVAFLDDDDEWAPTKLTRQVNAFREFGAESTVVSCRYFHGGGGGQDDRPFPTQLIHSWETVADYLFRRRKPKVDRPALPTSTLVTSRKMALDIPWSEGLKRHQDWDWLCRLETIGRANFIQVPEGLVHYTIGSASSVSASNDWISSLAWAKTYRFEWKASTYADFLAAQCLRYAIQARSVRGITEVLLELFRMRRFPALPCLALGLAGIVPRTAFEKIMRRRGRR